MPRISGSRARRCGEAMCRRCVRCPTAFRRSGKAASDCARIACRVADALRAEATRRDFSVDHKRRHREVGGVEMRDDRGEAAKALGRATADQDVIILVGRSEEHTSELQSLMRISYAVFCLKKKTKHIKPTTIILTYTINLKIA